MPRSALLNRCCHSNGSILLAPPSLAAPSHPPTPPHLTPNHPTERCAASLRGHGGASSSGEDLDPFSPRTRSPPPVASRRSVEAELLDRSEGSDTCQVLDGFYTLTNARERLRSARAHVAQLGTLPAEACNYTRADLHRQHLRSRGRTRVTFAFITVFLRDLHCSSVIKRTLL